MKKILVTLLVLSLVASCFGMIFASAEESQKLEIKSFEITSGDKQPVSETRNGNLIDGQLGDGASDQLDSGLWYSFEPNKNTAVEEGGDSHYGYIVLDLGEACTVNEIKVHFLGQHPAGISTIWGVFGAYSNDKENWTSLPNYADTGELGVWTTSEEEYWVSLVPQTEEPVVARYLLVKVAGMAAMNQLFVSEVEVYGMNHTPDESLEDVSSEEAVSEAESTEDVNSDESYEEVSSEEATSSETESVESTASEAQSTATSAAVSEPADDDGDSTLMIVLIAAVVVIVIAVVVIVVVRKKK